MLDERIIDLQVAIINIIGLVIFIFATRRSKDISKYLGTYIFTTLGAWIYVFNFVDESINYIADFSYALGAIIFFWAILSEESKLRSKQRKGEEFLLCLFILQFPGEQILLSFQLILAIMGFVAFTISIHILYIKRTIFQSVLVIITFSISFSALTIYLSNFNPIGTWELSYTFLYISAIAQLIGSIVALMEEKLRRSEANYRVAYNRAEFFKKLFTHDIGNILQKMKLSIEMMKQIQDDTRELETTGKIFKMLDEQSSRAKRLINNIQKLSLINDKSLNLKKIDIINPIKEAIKFSKDGFPQKQLEIELNHDGSKNTVLANDLLFDVIENLLNNAVKHNDKEKIEISIDVTEIMDNGNKSIKIEVKDNGNGIKDDLKEILFNQLITRENGAHGMGMGLFLIKKLLETYNGTITMEDRIPRKSNEGSNFVIMLPAAE